MSKGTGTIVRLFKGALIVAIGTTLGVYFAGGWIGQGIQDARLTVRRAADDGVRWREAAHLRADARWLLAAEELEKLPGAKAMQRPADDARAAVWLAALTEAAPPSKGAGTAQDYRAIEHSVDALERLVALDASWADTTEERLRAASLLSELAVVSPTFDRFGDPLHARALVALALAQRERPDSAPVKRSAALLLTAMGYRGEAMRAASALDPNDIVRAYVHGDTATLQAAQPTSGLERTLVVRGTAAMPSYAQQAHRPLVSDHWARIADEPWPTARMGAKLRELTVNQYPGYFGVEAKPLPGAAAWSKSADEVGDGPWLTEAVFSSLVDAAYGHGLFMEHLNRTEDERVAPPHRGRGSLDDVAATVGTIHRTEFVSPSRAVELIRELPFAPMATYVLDGIDYCSGPEPLRLAIEVAKASDRRPESLSAWQRFLLRCGDVALAETYRKEALDGEPWSAPYLGAVDAVFERRTDALFARIATAPPSDLSRLIMGYATTGAGEEPRIEAALQRAVQLRPDRWPPRKALTTYLQTQQRYAEALPVVEEFVPDPSSGIGRSELLFQAIRRSRYLRPLGRLDEAESIIAPLRESKQAGVLAEAAWVALAKGDQPEFERRRAQLEAEHPGLYWVPIEEVRALWLHSSDAVAARRTALHVGDDTGTHLSFAAVMHHKTRDGFESAIRALAAANADFHSWPQLVARQLQRLGSPDRALFVLRMLVPRNARLALMQSVVAAALAAQLGLEDPKQRLPSDVGFPDRYTAGWNESLWEVPIPEHRDHAPAVWTYRLALELSKPNPDPGRVQQANDYFASHTGWYAALGKLVAGQLTPAEAAAIHEGGEGSPAELYYWTGVRLALDADYDGACAHLIDAQLRTVPGLEVNWAKLALAWFHQLHMSTALMREAAIPAGPNTRPDYLR